MRCTAVRGVALASTALIVALMLSSCGCASSAADPAPVADRFGIHITGDGSRMQVVLPDTLTGAEWGLKQGIVSSAGFDLRPYAGTEVTLAKYPIRERYESEPLDLWLVESDGTVVGAYAAVQKGGSRVPGVFSVTDVGTRR